MDTSLPHEKKVVSECEGPIKMVEEGIAGLEITKIQDSRHLVKV